MSTLILAFESHLQKEVNLTSTLHYGTWEAPQTGAHRGQYYTGKMSVVVRYQKCKVFLLFHPKA